MPVDGKTVYKSLSLSGYTSGGNPCAVDVKNGKIIRVRPMHYDEKFTLKQIKPWKFHRNGQTFETPVKSLPCPFSLAYKKRAYSPNRVKYPLKRVDWDPNGERHTENRGKSKYMRISWDEAATIVAGELKRVHEKYGRYAVLSQSDGHAECKTVNAPHGCQILLHDRLGGFTQQQRNPDSWEGYYWGAMHLWGTGLAGHLLPSTNAGKDITENCDMLLHWGCDPETTPWGFKGQLPSLMCYFWSQVGIKQVYICPELNYGAAVHADKWIPVLPNTDAALQLAIIYTWLKEGTWDKRYVATHAVGMDKVEDYVLGKEDGVPKSPEWAAPKCGVPEWTIKALAREFAASRTTIAHHFGGGYIRGPYSTEPARLEGVLLGMQGLGKPGINSTYIYLDWTPRGDYPPEAGVTSRLQTKPGDRLWRTHAASHTVVSKQAIPKTLIEEAILNPPVTYWGRGTIFGKAEDQFVKYTYPLPREEGGTEIHMIWTDSPCRFTCWNHGNRIVEAFRSSKIECIVAQHPWLENDCIMADIILPSNTTLEVDDIVTNLGGGQEVRSITLQKQAIEPIGESKSDYEVVLEIAKKLGKYDEITQGKTIDDWIKFAFDSLGFDQYISWKELSKKGYCVFPAAPDWEKDPVALRDFYKDPAAHPLTTPTGKLEFYSEKLAKSFPDDNERPPIPKWIEKGITHDERLSSERARIYPLLMMSNHGRWRTHAQADDISWTREAPTCKVRGPDGYMYEPCWINPITAAERGIKTGDIVKAYNERGIVLGGAYVTERLMPGAVYMDHGSRSDPIVPGKIDRGGAIDLISPGGLVSKHSGGQATSGYLVQVEKLSMAEMEEWVKQYPEAFQREYDPASGLRFNAWVQESEKQ
jgi:molybdopterin guanine dinucleotide-containing S/N-oxide reductase-like protein